MRLGCLYTRLKNKEFPHQITAAFPADCKGHYSFNVNKHNIKCYHIWSDKHYPQDFSVLRLDQRNNHSAVEEPFAVIHTTITFLLAVHLLIVAPFAFSYYLLITAVILHDGVQEEGAWPKTRIHIQSPTTPLWFRKDGGFRTTCLKPLKTFCKGWIEPENRSITLKSLLVNLVVPGPIWIHTMCKYCLDVSIKDTAVIPLHRSAGHLIVLLCMKQ